MEFVTVNVSGKVTPAKLYGRDHLVAPLTLIREGVLAGSKGPLFYPAEELSKDPITWNNMPLVVYHPEKQSDGKYPIARQPSILNRQGVGQIFNTRFGENALVAEGWFDVESTKRVDERVYNSLVHGEAIELSTGVFTENEEAPKDSVFNTGTDQVSYTHIARNYRPDHVAILPDQVGACSLKDGCGVFNARGVSHDDIRSALAVLLRQMIGEDEDQDLWIESVFDNRVIYSTPQGLFLLGYSAPKGDIILDDDEPVEVKRVTSYQTVNEEGDQTGSSTNNTKEKPQMAKTPEDRKELIEGLIANSCCWEKTDQEELEAMTDNQLDRTKAASDKQIETEAALNEAQAAQNVQEPQIMTDEQWLAAAPESVRNTLAHAEKVQQQEREKLVEQITANVSDDAKVENVTFLADKSIEELEQIAKLIPAPVPAPTNNYFAGQPAPTQAVPSQPDATFNRDDTFEAPELEFESPIKEYLNK